MMTRYIGIASLAVLSFVALVFVLACVILPHWASRVGLDEWNLPTLRESLKEADAEAVALEEKNDLMWREREFCDYLIARLIDGTITLERATDELAPIMQDRPGFALTCETKFHVATRRQGVARCLISHVAAAMNNDSRWVNISARLEAEFAVLRE
jgi:hypothetical protein